MPAQPSKDRLAAARAARSRAYENRLAAILRSRGWYVASPGTALVAEKLATVVPSDALLDEVLACPLCRYVNGHARSCPTSLRGHVLNSIDPYLVDGASRGGAVSVELLPPDFNRDEVVVRFRGDAR